VRERSQRPTPAVQIVGYRLLGLSVVISGLAIFAAVLHKLRGSPLGVAELLALILAGAMTAAFLWYEWWLIRQGVRDK
jgi:hypothetical protein